ncbi:TPA: hypothetical protein I3318_004082 [Enterobacter hormaechei subsp. xiangfangensis]|uniref:primase-helicase zinc-binding domain-containing protein n=1 Tax=Enterobacter hormaechei TaxID=158836 RepID=UPI001C1CD553|nr:primase-helicase zinc-binding domain-containing protein [Enterobacter hormaechei]MCM7601131.1 hypothetical protein [Enterobacter hormaechei]MDR9942335.1 hypothetical protein [Enterobacter hormaechei subsp. xiangfangensis]HAS0844069.1 hypothetical protein [Enterobacter hormaechei subsp. xiangfangensis]HBL8949473.1 toprim domain-containing protein [Enterobacter hormaechei]HBL8990510.1 toprim domain-containing protein [Enterobacter hormaechei]
MANFFTDLNNFIKQKPLEYMHEFGIEIEPSTQIPCPICGGENRFNWRSSGKYANTGYCRSGDSHGGNVLQPLTIIKLITKFSLSDIGAHIGFNKSEKWNNPNHLVMRNAPKKIIYTHEHKIAELDYNKLDLFSQNVSNESKNATWRESPYLLTKGISKMMWIGGHGQTLLDYYRADGAFCAMQRISNNGASKLFISNSQKTGAFHCERNQAGNIETIFIGEGFGTVTAFQYSISDLYPASLFLTAGNDTNLNNVTIEARRCYPNANICILTDNDSNKDNAGLKATIKTMEQVNNCWWAMPVNVGEDWCDVFQRGKFAVRDEFQRVLKNSKPSI